MKIREQHSQEVCGKSKRSLHGRQSEYSRTEETQDSRISRSRGGNKLQESGVE